MKTTVALGDFELRIASDGSIRIDGGALFGTVPRTIWSALVQPDESNRVELTLNCLLIRTPGHTILVDTGVGEKLADKVREIYQIRQGHNLIQSLKVAGVSPEAVDTVINTHLHFDHCGGNTRPLEDNYRPTFPNARYVINETEWQDALHPDDRSRSSYLKENFLPLEQAGQLQLIKAAQEIVPGVRVIPTPGHTRGHQSVLIQSGGCSALYLGDVICLSQQLKPTYVTSFDLYPVELMNTRKTLLKQARDGHWLLIFDHEPKVPFAYVNEIDGKMVLEPVL